MLYSVWQRYNFESNLQHDALPVFKLFSCIQYDKDTILKAIYNWLQININAICAVFSMTKIQFWKQFTTDYGSELSPDSCIQYDKDTILKAIYNIIKTFIYYQIAVFSMTKIQFWKQFTTFYSSNLFTSSLYSVWQRYNFESNLQLSAIFEVFDRAVFSMTKIQFWKQFTTILDLRILVTQLYSVWQRYNFESNLQQNQEQKYE